MKALKITFEHGRIWKAETSDGRSAQGASLESALDKLIYDIEERPGSRYLALSDLFSTIPDSGSTGQIARGQASG